jgi:hypothetical protein
MVTPAGAHRLNSGSTVTFTGGMSTPIRDMAGTLCAGGPAVKPWTRMG